MRIYLLFLLCLLFVSCKKSPPVEVLGDPSVDYFSPGLGNVGDTILVIGQNFSKTAQNNVVKFGTVDAPAFRSTVHPASIADSLQVIVPAGASSAVLRLMVYTRQAVSKDTFFVTTGKWIKRASLPGGGRFNGVAFAIGDKGYVGLGTGEGVSPANERNDLWEYDPTADTWTRKADYPNGTLRQCTSFVINGKAYVGFGTQTTLSYLNNYSLYAYDPAANVWTKKATTPAYETDDVVGLAANNTGYIITGFYSSQFLTYDQPSDTWQVKANFPGPTRSQASGFVINNEIYVGGGNSGQILSYNDLWKYSPTAGIWTQLAGAPASGYPEISFSLNGKGYRGLPYYGGFYEYDPVANTWARKKPFPGIAYKYQLSFTVNNRAFVTCGLIDNGYSAETWEFVP
jgi:hypothetical protein